MMYRIKLFKVLIVFQMALTFSGCYETPSSSGTISKEIATSNDATTSNERISSDDRNLTELLRPATDYLSNEINFFPEELYFGDAVYITQFFKSKSDHEIILDRLNSRDLSERNLDIEQANVTLRYGDLIYDYSFGDYFSEWINGGMGGGGTPELRLPSRSRLFRRALIVEAPPLEDWDSPFWTKIREDVNRDGQVDLNVDIEIRSGTLFIPDVDCLTEKPLFKASHKIRIKKRILREMDMLDSWRQSKTTYGFPASDRSNDYYGKNTSLTDLWQKYDIHGERETLNDSDSVNVANNEDKLKDSDPYDAISMPYYNIMRVDHRKPPAGAAPTTVEGWRELETQFEPGVLRDEIHFANLMIKYSLARESNEDDVSKVKREIVEWLKSKPETQRFALIDYFCNEPLPSSELFSELGEELDFPHKHLGIADSTTDK